MEYGWVGAWWHAHTEPRWDALAVYVLMVDPFVVAILVCVGYYVLFLPFRRFLYAPVGRVCSTETSGTSTLEEEYGTRPNMSASNPVVEEVDSEPFVTAFFEAAEEAVGQARERGLIDTIEVDAEKRRIDAWRSKGKGQKEHLFEIIVDRESVCTMRGPIFDQDPAPPRPATLNSDGKVKIALSRLAQLGLARLKYRQPTEG